MSMAILVETSGCCRRGSRLICQQVNLLSVGGGTRSERAGPGVCAWARIPGPVDCPPGDGRPATTRWPRQLSKRNRTWTRAERNPFSRPFYFYLGT